MKKIVALMMALMMLTLVACGGQKDNGGDSAYKNDVAASALAEAVANAYGEQFTANMPADAAYLEMTYGITADMYDDFAAQIPMMSAHVDTLLIFKAKEGKAEAIKTAIETVKESMLTDGMQYPMNLPKIEASEVVVYGDYVCYARLGFLEDDTVAEEEAVKQHKELNKLALETIEGMLKK